MSQNGSCPHFHSTNAKFISQDPAFWETPQEYIEDPQQWNSYSYARNNPIVNIDPTGENAAAGTLVFGGGGAVITGGGVIVGTYVLGGAAIVVAGTVGAYYGINAVRYNPDYIGNQSTPTSLLSAPKTNGQNDSKKDQSKIGADSKPERGLSPDGTAPPVEEPGKLKVGPASRPSEVEKGGKSYWDPKGGEWRYSPGDKYHNPHWDYNPHQPGTIDGTPGNQWRNIPIDNKPPVKPGTPVSK